MGVTLDNAAYFIYLTGGVFIGFLALSTFLKMRAFNLLSVEEKSYFLDAFSESKIHVIILALLSGFLLLLGFLNFLSLINFSLSILYILLCCISIYITMHALSMQNKLKNIDLPRPFLSQYRLSLAIGYFLAISGIGIVTLMLIMVGSLE